MPLELRLDALDNPKIVTEALKLVDTRFKAIWSLQEIIVGAYADGPNWLYKKENGESQMDISATEYVEEWGTDRFFSDTENDLDDDYDIDNDSDFWRRAGD
jgi:hypothetical protein